MNKISMNHTRRISLKEWTFTLVSIVIFLATYIEKQEEQISLIKFLFIPIIPVVTHFVDKKFAEYIG
ncbi:hypothetical protein BN2127_JRS10_00879 [Bacillus subtilis]|nr:hypothetical protein BN2127_JRS10_00879 [Bacillus subtilis]